MVAFEKRRDHGAHRIVSVPVPETSFFLRAADGREQRKGRKKRRTSYIRILRECAREREKEQGAQPLSERGARRRKRGSAAEEERKIRENTRQSDAEMRRLKEGRKKVVGE